MEVHLLRYGRNFYEKLMRLFKIKLYSYVNIMLKLYLPLVKSVYWRCWRQTEGRAIVVITKCDSNGPHSFSIHWSFSMDLRATGKSMKKIALHWTEVLQLLSYEEVVDSSYLSPTNPSTQHQLSLLRHFMMN